MAQLLSYYRQFQAGRVNSASTSPTYEDLCIDTNISAIDRVIKYSQSSILLQRVVHVKMISELAKSHGYDETKLKLIPLLEKLSTDPENVVKQILLNQIALLAEICIQDGGEDGYKNVFIRTLLPITTKLLEDSSSHEVRHASIVSLTGMAKLVRHEDLGTNILSDIIKWSHDDENDEKRIVAAELFGLLAEILGSELCKQFVIPGIVALSEDPAFRVRKATAIHFSAVCKLAVEIDLWERLMPSFVCLSKDDMYQVRKACADNLCEVSKVVCDDIKVGVLIEIFQRLTQDLSGKVKHSILHQSGIFISTLSSHTITENILAHYCSCAFDPTGDPNIDAELKHSCAFCLPGVFLAIGKERWSELRMVYQNLFLCRTASVKQTLAYSLHEIAKIIGDEGSIEEELVPIFNEMIQDDESIQFGVIKHLASFLVHLTIPCRVSYLPLLHDILHKHPNPFAWRLRQCLAIQLPDLTLLTPLDSLYDTLFPLAMTLLQDPVASVRKESYRGVSEMIKILCSGSSDIGDNSLASPSMSTTDCQLHLKTVISFINALVKNDSYQYRQLWVELCSVFLSELPKELVEKHFLNGLLLLSKDPVTNVRISISKLLSHHHSLCQQQFSSWLFKSPTIYQCVNNLSQDCMDVYIFLIDLKDKYPDVNFTAVVKKEKEARLRQIYVDNNEIMLIIPEIHEKNRLDENIFDMPNIDGLPLEVLQLERSDQLSPREFPQSCSFPDEEDD